MSRVSLNKSQYGSRRVRKISSVRFVYGYNCVLLLSVMFKNLSHPSSFLSTFSLSVALRILEHDDLVSYVTRLLPDGTTV